MRRSTLLDEMIRKVMTEALRIEAARHESKRLVRRRKADLAELSQRRKQTLAVRAKS